MTDSALLEWSKKLIACPSVTDRGTRQIVELCAHELLIPAGIETRVISSPECGPDQLNLVAVVKAKRLTAPALVLNTHLDTVAPGDHALWSACGGDPFNPSLDGERIYGLGAADTKLDFAAKAIALINTPKPSRAVYLVGTFGEESGLRGANELASARLLPPHAPAFVGEPSGLALVIGNRGLNVFKLAVEGPAEQIIERTTVHAVSSVGKAAHSSTPHLGRNAIERALRGLAGHPELKVVELNGGDAVNKVPALCHAAVAVSRDVSLADVSALLGAEAPGQIANSGEVNESGGTAAPHGREKEQGFKASTRVGRDRWAIPTAMVRALLKFIDRLTQKVARTGGATSDSTDAGLTWNAGLLRCSGPRSLLEFELRQPPEISPQAVHHAVATIVQELRDEFRGLSFELIKVRANPGFRAEPTSETLSLATRALAEAGIKQGTDTKAGCTEAGVYAAMGLKPVVFGPGPSTGVIHAPNEYNFISQVETAARFYRALLRS